MKIADQILDMSPTQLRRMVADLQVKIATQDRAWAGGGHPDDWAEADRALQAAVRIRRDVAVALRGKK